MANQKLSVFEVVQIKCYLLQRDRQKNIVRHADKMIEHFENAKREARKELKKLTFETIRDTVGAKTSIDSIRRIAREESWTSVKPTQKDQFEFRLKKLFGVDAVPVHYKNRWITVTQYGYRVKRHVTDDYAQHVGFFQDPKDAKRYIDK